MKRFSEQLQKKSQTVKLSVAQRRDLRERLVAYMEYHPLPKTVTQKKAETYLASESFTAFRFNTPQFRMSFGFFAAILLILVPVVAERSLPGDVLYPVKVNINEEVRSGLSVSPYAKVEWETERLERRISEARLLASEGKLTEEVEAGVATAVKAHSSAAQEGIAQLRKSDSEEAAIAEITFESALSVQSEVLEGALKKEVAAAGGASTTPGRSVAALAGVVEEARKDATANQSGQTPSYEKLSARMEQETTRAYELFESIKGVAKNGEVIDVERRLNDVERKLAAAATLHAEEKADVEASADSQSSVVLPEVALLRTALSDLQKLISFMTDIDVRENVTVEELVPVTLTDEENAGLVTEKQKVAETLLAEVTLILENRDVDEKTEKLEFGLTEANKLVASSKATLTTDNTAAAGDLAQDALAILEDIKKLAGEVKIPESTIETEVGSTSASTTQSASTTEEVSGSVDGSIPTNSINRQKIREMVESVI